MADADSNSFDQFAKINAPKQVSGIDYLRSIYKALELPIDFVLQFTRLISPRVLVVDGRVFIADLFDSERHQDFLKSGRSESSAQFWTNLLEVTGLFDDLPESAALELAECLATSWNRKIESECVDATGRARVIHDKSTEEIFVVVGDPD